MKKNLLLSVATVILLVASLPSCRTSYEKVATDTVRSNKERALLAKACKEEFPPEVRYVEGKATRDTVVEYYDQSLLVDSLAVVSQDLAAALKSKSDSLAKKKVTKVVITVHRTDTLKVTDSAAIQQHVDRENALNEDLVKSHAETLQMGIERDQARADGQTDKQNARDRLWWLIISNFILLCIIFRKPLGRALAAAFRITLKI